MPPEILAIVTARNEGERIGATLDGLALAFPGVSVWVADDGSTDDTAAIAAAAGARVVRGGRPVGKGGAATAAARDALGHVRAARAGPEGGAATEAGGESLGDARAARAGREGGAATEAARESLGDARAAPAGRDGSLIFVFCDGDLGESARSLDLLAAAIGDGRADMAVAIFARRLGGGIGLAVGLARRSIRRRCGLEMTAPLSGQRALSEAALADMLPFAPGFGMETGMTIDAVRAGRRVVEIELDLSHRATGRTLSGFVHRARQLRDIMRAQAARA